MQEFISVKVQTLREVFSGESRFCLPWFQRAYAWATEDVRLLLTHVSEAATNKPADTHYLLGTIVIANEPGEKWTDIVDGQQRIMTLTILFSVLRDLELNPVRKAEIQSFIAGDTYRFVPQDGCADFFNRYVQAGSATTIEMEEDADDILGAQSNIMANREFLKEQFRKRNTTGESRWQLFRYLADHCYVVVHAFRDAEVAWRWLQRGEETQHRFNAAGKAKNTLIQGMPPKDWESCSAIWDECETLIGSNDLFELLGHVRLLSRRQFSGKPVEAELAKEFSLNKGGLAFMEQRLRPAASMVAALRGGSIGEHTTGPISTAIDRASWIDKQIWIPAAILWTETRNGDSETELFFTRLERLVWLVRLAGLDDAEKQIRILQLLTEIEAKKKIAVMKALEPDKELRDGAREALMATSVDRKHFTRPALRLISIAMGDDPAVYNDGKATIEHILPQGKKHRGPWNRDFPVKQSKSVAHRLGNLTLLEPKLNHLLANRPWDEKRLVYAKSNFILSRELMDLERWTPATLAERTKRLIAILFKYWELEP